MGRRPNREAEGDRYYNMLYSKYDSSQGGYTWTTGSGRNQQTKFYKSEFTPEQGGLYADKTHTSGTYRGGNPRYTFYNASIVSSIGLHAQKLADAKKRKSAAKPETPVSRGAVERRTSFKKQKTLARGRIGTILTGTLGGSQDDERKRRKTLLG